MKNHVILAILIAFISTFFAPATATAQTLKRGSVGVKVAKLQQRLICAGFQPGCVDSIFGRKTEAALRAAQKSFLLVESGRLNKMTDTALPFCYEVQIPVKTEIEDLSVLTSYNQLKTDTARLREDSVRLSYLVSFVINSKIEAINEMNIKLKKADSLLLYKDSLSNIQKISKINNISLFKPLADGEIRFSGEIGAFHGSTPSGRFTQAVTGFGQIEYRRGLYVFGGKIVTIPSFPAIVPSRNEFADKGLPSLNVATLVSIGAETEKLKLSLGAGPAWNWYSPGKGWNNLAVEGKVDWLLNEKLLFQANLLNVSGDNKTFTSITGKLTTGYSLDIFNVSLNGTVSGKISVLKSADKYADKYQNTKFSVFGGGEITLDLNKNLNVFVSGQFAKPSNINTPLLFETGLRGSLTSSKEKIMTHPRYWF